MAFLLINTGHAVAFSGGDGSVGNPYQIYTCMELQNIGSDLTASYALASDIDCSDTLNWNSGAGFEPIAMTGPAFTGQLNGNKHTILDLHINRSTDDNIALFGQTGSGALITNLKLKGGSVSGGGNTASLIGSATDTTIDRTNSNLSILGAGDNVGGLIGLTTGAVTISKSFSTSAVSSTHDFIGGLVGHGGDGLNISDSYSQSNVTGNNSVGGFIGGIDSWGAETTISYAYSSGAVTGNEYVGGFIGRFWNGYLTSIFSTSHVTPNGATQYGALFGYWDQMDGAGGDGMFYDATASGVGVLCDDNSSWSDDNGYCTAVNTDGTQPNYFKSFPPNGPIDDWNIDMIWLSQNGSYPLLWAFLTVPQAPIIIGADTANTSVSLMLALPIESQNANITDIVVQYRVHGTTSWSTFTHDPLTAGPVTVTGIEPGTDYDFQVATQNTVGSSAFSNLYTISTLADTTLPTTSNNTPVTPVVTNSPAQTGNMVEQSASGDSAEENTVPHQPTKTPHNTTQDSGDQANNSTDPQTVKSSSSQNAKVYIGFALIAIFFVIFFKRRQHPRSS